MQTETIGIIVEIAMQYQQMQKFEKQLFSIGVILGEGYAAAMTQPEIIASLGDVVKDTDTVQAILDHCIEQTNYNDDDFRFMVKSYLSGNRDLPVNIT